jgi:uncharacterized Fe-S radical SAM superfamily protein PflX
MFNYTRNLLKLACNNRHLYPHVAIYYITGQCNLNCVYCEDFGVRRNEQNQRPLSLEQVLKILRVVRSGVDALMAVNRSHTLRLTRFLSAPKKSLSFGN